MSNPNPYWLPLSAPTGAGISVEIRASSGGAACASKSAIGIPVNRIVRFAGPSQAQHEACVNRGHGEGLADYGLASE